MSGDSSEGNENGGALGKDALKNGGALGRAKELTATLGGIGYFPFAPGTWGSLVSLAVVYAVYIRYPNPWVFFTFTVASSILCLWSGSYVESVWGKDPGRVVVDEAAGMGLTLTGASFLGAYPQAVIQSDLIWLTACFTLFRVFDIVKPFGIRKLQSINGGIGILLDDLAAGGLAVVLMAIGFILIK